MSQVLLVVEHAWLSGCQYACDALHLELFIVPTRRLLHLILKVRCGGPALLCSHQAIGRESVLRALVRHQCDILLLHIYTLKHLARIHASFRLALSVTLLV